MRLARLKELGSESLIYGIGLGLARAAGILLVPFYTRVFTPEDYGVMGLVAATTTLLAAFAPLGSDAGAIRIYQDNRDAEHRKSTLATWVWFEFTVSVLVGAVVAWSAPRFAPDY